MMHQNAHFNRANIDNPFELEVAYICSNKPNPIEKRAASHSFDPNFKVKLQLPWQWHALARGLKDHYLTQLGYLNGIIGHVVQPWFQNHT